METREFFTVADLESRNQDVSSEKALIAYLCDGDIYLKDNLRYIGRVMASMGLDQ